MKLIKMFLVSLLFFACNNQVQQPLSVEGDWKFKAFVPGSQELNPQNQAMVDAIVDLFKDGTVHFQGDSIRLNSPSAGQRAGTYTLEAGKINAALGGNSQFSLNALNENGNLVILFNEDGNAETGKIVLEETSGR